MDKKYYNSLVENSNFKVKVWKKLAFGLLISNLLWGILVITADRSEKFIVIPPELKEQVWVKGSKVSSSYVEQMTNYFFQLLLTYNKQNVLGQYERFLRYVGTDKYESMKTFLYADVDRIQRNDLGSVFYPMGIRINGMSAVIEGEHWGMIGDKVITKKIKKYMMNFSYKNGNLNIDSYSEILN